MHFEDNDSIRINNDTNDLLEYLSYKLDSKITIIKMTSMLVSLLTIINIFFAFYLVGIFREIYRFNLMLMISLSVSTLILIFLFDYFKRAAESIYLETSEIMDSYYKDMSDEFYRSEIRTKLKIILRNYTQFSDLPIFPGKSGVGIYFLLNIAIPVVAFSLSKN